MLSKVKSIIKRRDSGGESRDRCEERGKVIQKTNGGKEINETESSPTPPKTI